MRYGPNHQAEAKAAILKAAGKKFRQDGFEGIGIDGLMAAVGMTSGAFYSKFEGKQDLIIEVVRMGLDKILDNLTKADAGSEGLHKFLKHYFSEKHCKDVEDGCFMPALTVDVARANSEIKEAFRQRIQLIVSKLSESLAGHSDEDRRKRAWGLLSMMIGALALARAMPDYEQAHEVLDNAFKLGESFLFS